MNHILLGGDFGRDVVRPKDYNIFETMPCPSYNSQLIIFKEQFVITNKIFSI